MHIHVHDTPRRGVLWVAINIDFSRKPDGYFAGRPYWEGTVHPKDLKLFSNYRRTYDPVILDELGRNIAKEGLFVPIAVVIRRGKAIVVDGHCRTICCQDIDENPDNYEIGAHVDIHTVKVLAFRELSEEAFLEIQISANLHERPPAHEEAAAITFLWRLCKRSRKKSLRNITIAAFARKIGRRSDTVRSAIFFMENASDQVINLVNNREISYGAGRTLALISDHEAQDELARYMLEKGLKYRDQIKGRVYEWIEAHGSQSTFEMQVEEVSPLKMARKVLYSGVAQAYYAAVAFWARIVKYRNEGFLPHEIFTKTAIEKILLGTMVHEDVLKIIGVTPSLRVPAEIIAEHCEICPVRTTCRGIDSTNKEGCITEITRWMISEIARRNFPDEEE